MTDRRTQAAELKAEGNALFVEQDYIAAHGKYSLALGLDENAILYNNRAACSQSLKKYAFSACAP